MVKLYIFGIGQGRLCVEQAIEKEQALIMGYIDNYSEQEQDQVTKLPIIRPEYISQDFDYIIISVMDYEKIYEQLLDMEILPSKIICFFSLEHAMKYRNIGFIDIYKWRIEALSYEYMKSNYYHNNNYKYELADLIQKESIRLPKILSADIAIDKICNYGLSLVRFGDGEFELINGKKVRTRFQKNDRILSQKLREVLQTYNEKVLVAIADNYGSLENYTISAANDIRKYMTEGVRKEHMALLNLEREYYDAYLSRPYLIYKDKENARYRFDKLKGLWKDRDVILVEGEQTRSGVGNDLFCNVKSLKRIIVPSKDAFTYYDQIKSEIIIQDKDALILLVIGPTATVMAYDLALQGYQALDIGQIDLEYEWYIRKSTSREVISYKYLHGLNENDSVQEIPECYRKEYEEQIIKRVLLR